MKIQSKILAGIAVSVAVSVVIALIAFSILRSMNTEIRRIGVYDRIIEKTHALNVLTASLKDGLDHSDIRQVMGVLGSLDDLLGNMTFRDHREEALTVRLQRNNRELELLIDQMLMAGVAGDIERERRRLLASQIWMKVGLISEDTDLLKDISDSMIISAQVKAGGAVITLIVILALTNGTIYLLSGRSILRAQEALRENEEWLRLFIAHAPASLAMFDRQMRYLNVSSRWVSDYNLGERDLKGISHYEVFPEIPERWKEIHRRGLAGEVVRADADRFDRADGSIQWLRWEVWPWIDAAGEIGGIVIFSEDVTEVRKQEEELRHFNRTLRALSNTNQAAIHAEDLSDFLYAVCRIIVENCDYPMVWIGFKEHDEERTVRSVAQAGFEEGYLEALKITWSDAEEGRGPTGSAIRTGAPDICKNMLTESRMRPWREQAIKRGYASSVALPLRSEGETFGALTIYSREPDSFSADEVKLLAELAGDLAYGISVLRLRLAHQESEKKLRESEAHLDLALRSAGMGAWCWDIVENKRHFDDQACCLFGINPETFTGAPEEFFRVLHPNDRETVNAALARTLERDLPYEAEYRAVWPDASVHYIIARGKLVRDDEGRPLRLNGLIWDISRSKLMEEDLRRARGELELRVQERTVELGATVARLEQTNRELEEFAFVASHDLQEPLRKIQTFCDIIRTRYAPALDGAGQGYLERVINSAARMRRLLDELLQYSRVAKRPEPFKRIDLVRLAREAEDVFEEVLRESGGTVEIEDMPEIEADENQMLRLFQNLIGNALKYRSEESPRIRIHGRKDDRGWCEIFVQDNGIGFDPRFAERIFKPFQRLHNSSEYEGTGMGLAICRKIAERHGGRISAESQSGKGSTFMIGLPEKQGKWHPRWRGSAFGHRIYDRTS